MDIMYIAFILIVIIVESSSETYDGHCGFYYGKICKKYIDDHKMVYYNSSMYNEEITVGLWDEMIITFDEPCRSAAEVGTELFY